MRVMISIACMLLIQACVRQSQDCSGGACGCYSRDDCPEDNICFLGTCQSAGYNIQRVHVDLMPSNATGFLQQADPDNPRDLSLRQPLIIRVRDAVMLRGHIASVSSPLGGVVTAQAHRTANDGVVLPSSQATQQAVVGPDQSFSLSLVPGIYDVTAQPTHGEANPLPPLTLDAYNLPANAPGPSLAQGVDLELQYPVRDLLALSGNVVTDFNSRTPVVGARITGVATDANASRLVAAPAVTDANGRYTLRHLPGARTFTVATHPGSTDAGNPLVPSMTFAVATNANHPLELGTQALNTGALGAHLALSLSDVHGAAVAGTTLQFTGEVGGGGQAGSFRTSAVTGEDGSAQATLLPGVYSVLALPAQGHKQVAALVLDGICVALSDAASPCGVSVNDGDTVPVTLMPQVEATGTVSDHTGKPVSGARVEYTTTVDATHRRVFASHTDPNGLYSVHVDPGTPNAPRTYELSVEPPASSALPRYRALVRVVDGPLTHNVTIYAPAFVYGTVTDPNDEGLSDVTIALYSTELGSAGQPLLIGLGKSLSGGEFAIPIPTANGEY